MSKVSELEKQLVAKEKTQKEAEGVLGKAWEARKAARERIQRAEEDLARFRASISAREGGDPESWTFRRKWKAAEEALAAAKREDDERAAEVTTAQRRRDEISDEVLQIRAELAGPRLEALRGQVSALVEDLRGHQAAAVEAGKKLVRIYVDAEAAAPPRIVLRRAVNHYLVVCPKDPLEKEAVGERLECRGIPKGYFRYEYFRAMKESGPDGKYELWDGPDGKGQDLSPPPPEQIETIFGEPILPSEIAGIKELDLGLPVEALNGKPEGKHGRGRRSEAPATRITFHTISEELEQAAWRKA